MFTTKMSRSPHPGETHPPVPPTTPIFDAFAYLSYLAGLTERVRLGTHVYNIGLRHPFVTARAVQTLDIVSKGRVRVRDRRELARGGVGRDRSSTSRRAAAAVDETIEVCQRLWTEDEVATTASSSTSTVRCSCPSRCSSRGRRSSWAARARPRCGARRAVRRLDRHEPRLRVAERTIARLHQLLDEHGRSREGFQVCLGARSTSRDDAQRWEDLGVTRIVFSPWTSSREAIDGMRRFAAIGLTIEVRCASA
jgi:alkanesulfonate monooxygenase SsuD/methylene tetrahydromethanopterin reductase-like flavin-dependent oxidoreductase (luciferase family)